MDEQLTRHLARRAFTITRELQDVMVLLKTQLDEGEYCIHARAIANSIQTVNEALLDGPLTLMPSIRSEIDASIARYGR